MTRGNYLMGKPMVSPTEMEKDGIKEIPTNHWLLIESYTDKRLVPILRRLRDNGWKLDALSKEEFSSELMYEYAVEIMSALKGVSGVMVAKDYVVINYEVVMFKQNDVENTRFVHVLLGLDENGKLWVREIEDVVMTVTCEKYNDVIVCLTTNESIRRALGYRYELPSDGVIKETGTYRVQGDLLLDVDVINIGAIRAWYEDSTRALLKWKCLDRFYGELIKHGIDPDLREAYENPSNPVLRIRLMKKPDERDAQYYQVWRRVEHEIYYPLRDYVVKQLSGGGTWVYPVSIEDVRLDCHVYPAEYNNSLEVREYTVVMRLWFDIDDNYYLHQKIEGLLLNHVISDTGYHVYKLGRHEIQAYNVGNPVVAFQFPQSWTEDIQYLQPLPPELTLKPSNYPRIVFVVNRDSKVVIKHPEHKEVVLTFDGFYMVTVETERKVGTFTALMNETVIDKIKQLSKE
jgi:hypothetical protein